MRKILLILLINISPMIYCFTQDTYPKIIRDSLLVITPEQLKQTNLIFLEHNVFKNKINELEDIIKIQNDINNNLNKDIYLNKDIIYEKDSIINNNTILLYQNSIKLDTYKNINRRLIIGGIGVTITLGLLLILN